MNKSEICYLKKRKKSLYHILPNVVLLTCLKKICLYSEWAFMQNGLCEFDFKIQT